MQDRLIRRRRVRGAAGVDITRFSTVSFAMKTRFPAALTCLAIAGSGLAYVASAAPDPAAPPPPKLERPEFTPADRAAFFDARVAALRAGLKLTPDQEKLWPPVEAAARAAAANAQERWEKARADRRPDNLVDRLRADADNAIAGGQNLQALAAAAAPLYATLTEEQKHRLPALLHGIGPLGPPRFAFAGDARRWGGGPWGEGPWGGPGPHGLEGRGPHQDGAPGGD
jgi:zinc resistance-associated protein